MASSSSDHGPFKLSATLTGHSQDVRGVLYPDPSTVLSCSRDTTATLWKPRDGSTTEWQSHIVYQNAHEGFVSAIDHITEQDGDRAFPTLDAGPGASSSEGGPEYVVTGGRDTLIQLWAMRPDLSAPYAPRFTLAGHTANVCCLSVASNSRTVVSGSWDCTARVWRNHQVAHTLVGHTAAVWAVLALDDHGRPDEVLTAAADNLIFHWRAGKQAGVLKGHTQAVRALVVLPDSGAEDVFFASASNDATIKLWSLSKSTCLSTLNGHDSFVYSLALIPSTGELVSSGEDRTVRIWDPSNQTLKQTITLPAISIWSVAACHANGDIAVGSSDSLVRLFTRSTSRLAPAAAVEAFDESVKASSVPSATVGDVKKSDLPGEEALRKPGSKEGQVLMVKNSMTGAVEAHQWSTSDYKWVMVGTVVDGVGSSKRQLFEGREYDYVFDVDIKDGVPPLKLPYNASGESPLPEVCCFKILKNRRSCAQTTHTRSRRSGSPSTSCPTLTSTRSSTSSTRIRVASQSADRTLAPTPSPERAATDQVKEVAVQGLDRQRKPALEETRGRPGRPQRRFYRMWVTGRCLIALQAAEC